MVLESNQFNQLVEEVKKAFLSAPKVWAMWRLSIRWPIS